MPVQSQEDLESGHQPRRALKHWRMLLDKIYILLVYSGLQEVVGEWFPQLPPSHALLEGSEPETLQDVYATLIQGAKVLTPLRGKNPPMVAASSCIHPTARLKGGGNSSASYVTCQDCHTRWEIHARASFRKKELKEEKKGGPLKLRPKTKPRAASPEEEPHLQMQEDFPPEVWEEAISLRQELERQNEANRESSKRQEAMLRSLMKHQEELQQQLGRSQEEDNRSKRSNTPPTEVKCKCGDMAEPLKVKKEGARKGRTFYKCMQRRCDFFQWDSEGALANWSPPCSSSSIAASSQNPPPRRAKSPADGRAAASRRSKSPKTSKEDTAGKEGSVISIASSRDRHL